MSPFSHVGVNPRVVHTGSRYEGQGKIFSPQWARVSDFCWRCAPLTVGRRGA